MNQASFFEKNHNVNILIVGDVMIDRYITGNADRISPEAPVPVVRILTRENRLGGAANVALNLNALGVRPFLCGMVGKDENAIIFKNLLEERGIYADGIYEHASRITTVKTRIIAGNQHLLRCDTEMTTPLGTVEEQLLLGNIEKILAEQPISSIILQDYNKGVLTPRVIEQVIAWANKNEIPTVVDPKVENFWKYKNVTIFKPNLKEINQQLDFEVNPKDINSLQRAAQAIQHRLANKITIITLSEYGIYVYENGEGRIIPTTPRLVSDVCGAGDTVVSVLSLTAALSWDSYEAAAIANLAGGQVCEKVGVQPVDKTQLEEEYIKYIKKMPS